MTGGRQWSIWTIVVLAHAGMLLWLAQAMRPPNRASEDEIVTWVEWIEQSREPEPAPAVEVEPAPQLPLVEPPIRRRSIAPHASAPMQAVIEPRVDALLEGDAPREFVSPERDPFSRPVDPEGAGFGRRERPALPDAVRPRITGERPLGAPLPEYHGPGRSPKRIVETIASFLSGGSNAPIEVPCGSRMNGGDYTAESFSPDWQRRNGCGDGKTRAGFDGSYDQPPGTVGSH